MAHRNPITMHEVQKATETFLLLHWNTTQLVNIELPGPWSSYDFIGSVPYGERQGCYALIKNSEVIYIGLGASRGGGIYEGHGIGARLNNHVLTWDKSLSAKKITERVYKPQEKWAGISEIYTFGFPKNHGYLACSLEAYLISRLEPERNVTKSSTNRI